MDDYDYSSDMALAGTWQITSHDYESYRAQFKNIYLHVTRRRNIYGITDRTYLCIKIKHQLYRSKNTQL